MSSRRRITLALLCFAAASTTLVWGFEGHVRGDKVDGRVFDSTTDRGIPGMIVRLTPPRSSQEPERVTRTGVSGEYGFTKVKKGRYLLQVYLGSTLLFRRLIDTSQDQDFLVTLRRKQ